jgi:hypothetical protein
MKKLSLFSILILAFAFQNATAQLDKLAIKFNTGMSFSKPGDDLGEVAVKGKAMQLFTSLEGSYHVNYTQNTQFGFKGAVVLGQDWANFLAADRSTELKVSVPNARLRVYPLAYHGNVEEAFEKIAPEGLPFLIEIPVWIGIYSSINSLHFDYGIGSGKILETDYIGIGFQDETVKRTMKYFGWGLQPVIYQSESEKWSCNAVFDFGKYSWTNANGGTSSFKSNHVGFGVQYHFLN